MMCIHPKSAGVDPSTPLSYSNARCQVVVPGKSSPLRLAASAAWCAARGSGFRAVLCGDTKRGQAAGWGGALEDDLEWPLAASLFDPFWMRSSSIPKRNGKSLGLNQFHLIPCNSMPKDEWWNDRRPMIHNLIYPLVIKHGNGKSSIYPNDFPNKSSIL